MVAQAIDREQRRVRSISRFMDDRTAASPAFKGRLDEAAAKIAALWKTIGITDEPIVPSSERRRGRGEGEDTRVPARARDVKGPLGPGDPWVQEKAGDAARALAINRSPYPDVTFEIVNFIDGTRTISDIRDAVSAEFGPVPLPAVVEYLELLARVGAVTMGR
jgi:hypothetical protein